MSRPDLDWTLCRTFLAILRAGSLSGAGRDLRLSHVTIRRQLEALEGSLGAPLFTRSQAGLQATGLADRVAPAATAMEAAAAALLRAATADEAAVAGSVRITASEVVGAEVLPAILERVQARHPGLVFELVLSNAPDDLLRRDADIAVRMTRPVQAGLVASKVGTVGLGLYAHQRWIARNGLPEGAAALTAQRVLIGQDRRTSLLPALADLGLAASRGDLGVLADSDLAQLAAVRAGLGVGVVQHALAARDPALVRILPAFEAMLEVWTVVHPDLRGLPHIKVVLDVLRRELKTYSAYAPS